MKNPEHNTPLISVVIPTYNYASVIERALDSVLGQWADDLELVVVDDGSCDNTGQLLVDYVARHPAMPIQLVRQDNAGPAAARNRGIRLATGKFILLLDADDALLPGALDCLRKAVEAQPDIGLVLGGQISVFPDGRERLRQPTPVAGSPRQRVRRYLLQKRISIAHGSMLCRRDLLLQRPYPEALRGGEDIPVFAYLLAQAQVALVADPLVRIYKHADSLRHRPREDAAAYVECMAAEVFSMLPADCKDLRRRYAAQRYLSLFRAAILAHDRDRAWRCYQQAIRLSPVQSIRPDYLRKLLKLVFSVG